MTKEELKIFMTFRKEDTQHVPLSVFEVNGSYIMAIYGGSLSEFDILIKYRQKYGEEWSRIRTPKHIHWAVDILIKLHEDEAKTQAFLDFLLGVWERTEPFKNIEQQQALLTVDTLTRDIQPLIEEYETLSSKGEYSVKFLILLAKLLMMQEKTNLENAYMFKNLLNALRKKGDIFSAISTASHVGR